VDKESANATRLVLGYDGGCLSCSMLAQKIRQRVGDKLVIENLRDVRVQGWRKEALVEDAPWSPTLFEVDDELRAVRAWTGLRVGLALTRALGPVDTWKVIQAIGEMRPTKEKLIPGGFSRGQFLTGLGGAALAMTMLSGTGKLASPAEAHGDHHLIKGSDLVDKARNRSQTQDVRNVAGHQWVDRMAQADVKKRCAPRDNEGCMIVFATGDNCHIELTNKKFPYDIQKYCTIPHAVKHANIDGGRNGLLKVAWAVPSDNRLIVYKEYDKPFNPKGHGDVRIETEAHLFKMGSKWEKRRLEAVSINGTSRRVRHWK
jgi:hypothetical protein